MAILIILFPIWVAIHAWRKDYRKLAVGIGVSYLLPPVPLALALAAFFVVKPYRPDWDYIPSPRSFFGCGTRFYGHSKRQPDRSFVTTEWFGLFYIPLVPIQSYRVIHLGEDMRFLGAAINSTTSYTVVETLKLDFLQVAVTYAFLFSFPAVVAAFVVSLKNTGAGPEPLFAVFAAYAVLGFWLFRAK